MSTNTAPAPANNGNHPVDAPVVSSKATDAPAPASAPSVLTPAPSPQSPQGSPLEPSASTKSVDAIASAPDPTVLRKPARLLKVLLAMRDEERKEQKLPPFPTPPEANYNFPQYVFVSTRPPPPAPATQHTEQMPPLQENYEGLHRAEPIVREPTPALPKTGDVPPLTGASHARGTDHLIHASAVSGSYPPPSSSSSSSSASAPHYTSIYDVVSVSSKRTELPAVMDLGDRPVSCEDEYNKIKEHFPDRRDTRSTYLISATWWDKWLKYTQIVSAMEIPPPIDNTDLLETTDPLTLKKGLKVGRDCHELSETQWTALQKWYSGGPAIARMRKILQGKAEPILYPVRVLVTTASSITQLQHETVDSRWTVKQMKDMVAAHMSSPPHKSKLQIQKNNKASNSPWVTLVDEQISLAEAGIEESDVFTVSTGGSDRNSDVVELSRQSVPEVRVTGSVHATHDDYPPPLVPSGNPSVTSQSSHYSNNYYQDDDADLAQVLAMSLAEETERQERVRREEEAAKAKAAAASSSATAASTAPASAAPIASASIPPATVPAGVPDYSTPLQPMPVPAWEGGDYANDSDDENVHFPDSDDDTDER